MYYDGFDILRGLIYTSVLSLFAHEAIYILLLVISLYTITSCSYGDWTT